MLLHLPPELRTELLRERRHAKLVAREFIEAARDGAAERLLWAAGRLDDETVGWRLAMKGVARLPSVTADIQAAFVSLWVERKHVALRVGHRPTMARAARVLLASNYAGPPLRLYRGTTRNERRRHLYGFSWTTRREIAQRFADQHSEAAARLAASPYYTEPTMLLEGVVLETVAPAHAILLRREDEDHYDEGEVLVDPFRLGRVMLAR